MSFGNAGIIFVSLLLLEGPEAGLISFKTSVLSGKVNFCDPQTQHPCNSPFFQANCDVSLCATHKKKKEQHFEKGQKHETTFEKHNLCTCMNYNLQTELRFRDNIMLNERCIHHQNLLSPHDYPLCLKVCQDLQRSHNIEGLVNPLYSMALSGVYGCFIDVNSSTGYSPENPHAADHLHCFCYTSLPVLIASANSIIFD